MPDGHTVLDYSEREIKANWKRTSCAPKHAMNSLKSRFSSICPSVMFPPVLPRLVRLTQPPGLDHPLHQTILPVTDLPNPRFPRLHGMLRGDRVADTYRSDAGENARDSTPNRSS